MSLLGKWFGFGREEIFDRGLRAYDRGDFEGCIEALETCLDGASDASMIRLCEFYIAESYARLGLECLRSAQAEHAAAHFERAISMCPSYPDLHLHAAKAYRMLGLSDLRRQSLEKALRINPKYVDAVLQHGILLVETGQLEQGLGRIEEACSIDASLRNERYKFAKECLEKGDVPRAIANFNVLSSVAANDANLHARVADSFRRQGMYEEAAQEYARALAIAPHFADVRCRYGQTLTELGKLDEAIGQFREALRVNTRYAAAYAHLGLALRMAGRDSEAREAFRHALDLNPDQPLASEEFARMAG